MILARQYSLVSEVLPQRDNVSKSKVREIEVHTQLQTLSTIVHRQMHMQLHTQRYTYAIGFLHPYFIYLISICITIYHLSICLSSISFSNSISFTHK